MQLGIQLGTAHATHSSGGGRGKMQIEREPPGQDDLAVKHLDGAGWGNAQLSKEKTIIKRILNDIRVDLSDEFDQNFEREAFFLPLPHFMAVIILQQNSMWSMNTFSQTEK